MSGRQSRRLRRTIFGENGASRERTYAYKDTTRVCTGKRRSYQASKRGTLGYKLTVAAEGMVA